MKYLNVRNEAVFRMPNGNWFQNSGALYVKNVLEPNDAVVQKCLHGHVITENKIGVLSLSVTFYNIQLAILTHLCEGFIYFDFKCV